MEAGKERLLYQSIRNLSKCSFIDEISAYSEIGSADRTIKVRIITDDAAHAFHLDLDNIPFGLQETAEHIMGHVAQRTGYRFSIEYLWRSEMQDPRRHARVMNDEEITSSWRYFSSREL